MMLRRGELDNDDAPPSLNARQQFFLKSLGVGGNFVAKNKNSLKNSSVEGILGILLQLAIKQELLLFYSITSDLDVIKTQI